MKENNLSCQGHKSTDDSTTDLALEFFAKLPHDLKKLNDFRMGFSFEVRNL